MRKIDLGIGFSTQLPIDLKALGKSGGTGRRLVHVGTIDIEASREIVNTARENGAQVVWAALEIESDLKQIISLHMFDPAGINPARDFLNKDILGSSAFTFSFKRKLVQVIADRMEIFEGKDKQKFPKVLRHVEDYRNAFAHGKISARNNEGVLEYFSGDHKEDVLSDAYWDELEKDFSAAKKYLKRIIDQKNLKLSLGVKK
jgi:dsDNA-specific endonuclease/ATPase MutS2